MANSIRVLHILNELKPSGAEAMLRCAAPIWVREGVQCDLLSTGMVRGPFASALERAGYRILHLPNTRDVRFLHRLRNLLRAEKYDVVHQHAEQMSFWICAVARLSGSRVVRTVHNNFMFDGLLRARRALQRQVLLSVGVRFVTIGDSVFSNERARFGTRSTVVRNWADFGRTRIPTEEERKDARSLWGLSDKQFVIVSLGNCSPVKNHDAILRGLALCEKRGAIHYLHLGIEAQNCRERALAAELGISDRVTFVGWLDDPTPALHAADAFVMPSQYEGFSIAALEAIASGLPAILSDRPGLRDLRKHFRGIVFIDPSGVSVADALTASIDASRRARERLADENRAVAIREFGPERGVREYGAMYREMVMRHRPQGEM